VKVALGGIHPTIYPKETAALDCVDFAVAGEGEGTMVSLAASLDGGKSPDDVRGLAYRDCGRVVYTGVPEFIEDLDALPFPARKLTPYGRYGSLLSRRRPSTTMFTSRGCPHRCIFCDRPQMGKRFRARSAANVVDELQECSDMGIREVLIYDDTFTLDRRRVLDICEGIRERGLDVVWDARARVDTVDGELLSAMRSAGCDRIHFGVESGNGEILKTLCKGITLAQAEDAFRLASDAGIQTLAYFMIGAPHETVETVRETMDFAQRLDPDYVHFSIATPFPATGLYRMGLESGMFLEDYWQSFARKPAGGFVPAVWEENLGREELTLLLREAYRGFYLRPGYALRRLADIRSPGELVRKANAALRVALA
jgi:anaerobic magnesium-protoporphyrin IX monomethyl ester cyclase